MKKTIFLLIAVFCLSATAKNAPKDSRTSYAKTVLQPYVDSGQLAGAISVFYKDGVQETCCIGYAAASPIMFEPGTRELYSNTGIDIGAAVVEVVTGMKWEAYLKQDVLDPLGMKSTWFWHTDE